ncbi:hypothetical protein CAEBREN_26272 [Caenorhabditis brenneri]|uniref:Uncharacterized protein n=1 Tax=Caenorhabditis brenneri TaxID=135651 RepID=G0N8S1_CAEBE|nr:hypothetical protein CAEBREN_26272 [Caenorhabditis brenneri]
MRIITKKNSFGDSFPHSTHSPFVPKFFAFCSFLINPLFIFLILKDTKLNLGNYKYLLFYFSIFNMSCSMCDILVPICIFNYRYAFTIFVTEGYFETPSDFGRYILSFRCSYITGTYAILHSHFLYRYMILVCDNYLDRYFFPFGLLCSIFYCLLHMAFWTLVAGFLSSRNLENRLQYVRDPFEKYFGQDPFEINVIIAQYSEASEDFIQDTWIGIVLLSVVSFASLSLICFLGYLIVRELKKQTLFMSATTKRQQTQLIKALVIQTITPTIACFSPCFFFLVSAYVWNRWRTVNNYEIFEKRLLFRWLQHVSAIVMSIFPFFDPLSTLLVLPSLRRQLKCLFKCNHTDTPVQSRVRGTETVCF